MVIKTVLAYVRYFVFLALIVFLYFFNNHPAFLLILFALLLAPVISVSLFFLCVGKVALSVKIKSAVLYREENTSFSLNAVNASVYPFPHAVFYCSVSNNLNPNDFEHIYDLFIAPGERMQYEIPLRLTNCGSYTLSLRKVVFRDLLGLVHRTITPSVTTAETIVFPMDIDLEGSIEGSGGSPNEEAVYERFAKGSDPSEIFEIREYRLGDRPQQIHWKLSAKQRNLMAKEFSDVVGESYEIFLCNDYTDNHQMDAYYDVMFSLGMYLARKGILFSYSWYSDQNAAIEKRTVDSEEKVSEVLISMYYIQARNNNRTAFQLITSLPEGMRHVMVLTSQPFPLKQQSRQLINLNNLVRLYTL